MKVLVAPDKFKGSLSAAEAARAIAEGWRAGWGECEIVRAPIADGGEGFAEVFCEVLGGEWIEVPAHGALGRPIRARFVWVASARLAVLEMSEASGLWRLKREELAPLRAETFGTGEVMRAAIERGAERLFVGLGGSATTDGGIGMAAALGYEFLDAEGKPLEARPDNLAQIARIRRPEGVSFPEIVAACDVTNPLLGPKGTARVFAPQKGADPATVPRLEAGLQHLAEIVARDLGIDFRDAPGAGAAGGIGYGLMTFCGAQLRSGFDLVAEQLGLAAKIGAADLVITGEGRLDSQTLDGKGPGGVARLAREAGKPVLALAGSVQAGATEALYDWAFPIVEASLPLERAMAGAEGFLRRAAKSAGSRLRLGEIDSPKIPRASQAAAIS